MPTVRVDDEVWQWLKRHARPFEDTPNSVLRRIAGLDAQPREGQGADAPMAGSDRMDVSSPGDGGMSAPRPFQHQRQSVRITGESLNRRHNLGLRHSLYHKDGTFYERLTRYPGGLCDPSGYVRFDSERQFTNDPHISVGQKVNVHGGIASHPRYRRFAEG